MAEKKKGLLGKFIEKLDKKMKDKAQKEPRCCCGQGKRDKECCK